MGVTSLTADVRRVTRSLLPLEQRPLLELLVERTRLLAERHLLFRDTGTRIAGWTTEARQQAADFFEGDPAARGFAQRLALVEEALAHMPGNPLTWLGEVLGLLPVEVDFLSACAAAEVDPELRGLFGRVHGRDAWSHFSHAVGARLFGVAVPAVSKSGALFRWRLLVEQECSPGDPTPLSVDPFVLQFLAGGNTWDAALGERLANVPPLEPLPAWPVAEIAGQLEAFWGQGPSRCLLTGATGSGRRTFAACVAARLGMPLVFAETAGLAEEDFSEFFLRAQRQALLLGHALVWGPDYCDRRLPGAPAQVPLQFVIAGHGQELPVAPGVLDERVHLAAPDMRAREALWRQWLPAYGTFTEAQQQTLAERYRVQVGDIRSVAARGATDFEQTQRLCASLTRGRLGDLAHVLDCPFTFDDLKVPRTVELLLGEFLHEAKARAPFWERPEAQRLFPRGRGLIGLLAGPPGTGKTMAAQVVAAELGLELVRIDLATVVSKYIGETAKNLRRLFTQVRDMNAVLFFDEADALFAKRTEVKDSHDRYANADTNYLLQHLEEFEGIALLATNKRANMDAAFVRRLRYVLEFPRPRSPERAAIFRSLLGQLAPAANEDLEQASIDLLAETFDLSGAQIKLSVLSAVFGAQGAGEPVGLPHLLRGIDRELAKEGRRVSEAERQRVLRRRSAR